MSEILPIDENISEIEKNCEEIRRLLVTFTERDLIMRKALSFYKKAAVLRRKVIPMPFYSSLAPLLTPEMISFLGNHPSGEINLVELGKRISPSGKFLYWRHILQQRHLLPPEELFRIWFQIFNYHPALDRQQMETDPQKVVFILNSVNKKWLSGLPLTDPLLADNTAAAYRMVQVEKPGFRFLRYINHRSWQPPRGLGGKLLSALNADNLEQFLMFMDMAGVNINFGLVMKIIKAEAYHILRHLFKADMIPKTVVTPGELCCMFVVESDDREALEMLSLMEEIMPGVIKNTKDELGRNLLWYLIHNKKTVWFHPNCRLTGFLLEHGCGPENKNTLGLSWKFINECMSQNQKQQIMQERLNETPKLSKTQPPGQI